MDEFLVRFDACCWCTLASVRSPFLLCFSVWGKKRFVWFNGCVAKTISTVSRKASAVGGLPCMMPSISQDPKIEV